MQEEAGEVVEGLHSTGEEVHHLPVASFNVVVSYCHLVVECCHCMSPFCLCLHFFLSSANRFCLTKLRDPLNSNSTPSLKSEYLITFKTFPPGAKKKMLSMLSFII